MKTTYGCAVVHMGCAVNPNKGRETYLIVPLKDIRGNGKYARHTFFTVKGTAESLEEFEGIVGDAVGKSVKNKPPMNELLKLKGAERELSDRGYELEWREHGFERIENDFEKIMGELEVISLNSERVISEKIDYEYIICNKVTSGLDYQDNYLGKIHHGSFEDEEKNLEHHLELMNILTGNLDLKEVYRDLALQIAYYNDIPKESRQKLLDDMRPKLRYIEKELNEVGETPDLKPVDFN